ncbi:MAG: hypothetical protein IJH39_11100 [Clostridia bacterium]|nr:hypothetical protein [Clostridia bacterium]
MKAIVKNTGETVNVEKKTINIDEMTSYFVYENEETKEVYKYNELTFNK